MTRLAETFQPKLSQVGPLFSVFDKSSVEFQGEKI